jgi:hypothetical protein
LEPAASYHHSPVTRGLNRERLAAKNIAQTEFTRRDVPSPGARLFLIAKRVNFREDASDR